MRIIIFSENHWDSPLKYQRHHLADYLSKDESITKVYFFSKVTIRLFSFRDISTLVKQLFWRNNDKIRRKKDSNIETIEFNLIPFQKNFKFINATLKNRLIKRIEGISKSEKIVLISYQPFPCLLEIATKLAPHRFIYISVHDFENMALVSKEVCNAERKIIEEVDLFTTDSLTLFEKLAPSEKRLISLSPACPYITVLNSKNNEFKSTRINKIIYFGTLASYLDWGLLKTLANNGYTIDFLGVEYDVDLKNILSKSKLYKPRDFEDSFDLFQQYDALILPYVTNLRNDHIIPAKIYECFSLGMPVFTSTMKWAKNSEINRYLFCYVDAADLILQLENFNLDNFLLLRDEMLNYAEKNSWDERFKPLLDYIKN